MKRDENKVSYGEFGFRQDRSGPGETSHAQEAKQLELFLLLLSLFCVPQLSKQLGEKGGGCGQSS